MHFAWWGIDLLGPFPKATGGKDHLEVAIDHFTRWIEVKALATIIQESKRFFLQRCYLQIWDLEDFSLRQWEIVRLQIILRILR